MFHITRNQIGDYDWLFRKGIFPYTWFDDVDKLEDNALPPKEAFYDTLTQACNITDKEYQIAQSVWTSSSCHTFKDYLGVI